MKYRVNPELQFPPRGETLKAPEMLKALAERNPNFAFAIIWPKDGSLPTFHSSLKDVPVLLMRMQEFIHAYYNGEIDLGELVNDNK